MLRRPSLNIAHVGSTEDTTTENSHLIRRSNKNDGGCYRYVFLFVHVTLSISLLPAADFSQGRLCKENVSSLGKRADACVPLRFFEFLFLSQGLFDLESFFYG